VIITIKKISVVALALVGCLFAVRPAGAQGSAGGQETVSGGFFQSSTFNVLATQSAPNSDLWTVTVSWAKNSGLGAYDADEVQVGFLNSSNKLQTISSAGSAGVGSTTYNKTGSTSTIEDWSDPSIDEIFGIGTIKQGSSFTGTVQLSSSSNPIYAVEFALNGGSFTSFVDPPITGTPEGQSLALLLPGLIPLALIARRRAKA